MKYLKHLAIAPVLALGLVGVAALPASADTNPLSEEAVGALALAHCQADPELPVTLEELAPVVVGQSDVEVVPGEITAHVVRLEVAGGESECTVGVLHRDVQLAQVVYEGTATVAGVVTEIELGNMGKSAPVDPTTEVDLGGVLVAAADVVEDPAFEITLTRKSLETVQIAVHRSAKDAAAKLLKAELKAAAQLEKKQIKAAGKGKGAAKAIAAAQKAHDKKVAAAKAKFAKSTTPKTVVRPVGADYSASGTVARTDVLA